MDLILLNLRYAGDVKFIGRDSELLG